MSITSINKMSIGFLTDILSPDDKDEVLRNTDYPIVCNTLIKFIDNRYFQKDTESEIYFKKLGEEMSTVINKEGQTYIKLNLIKELVEHQLPIPSRKVGSGKKNPEYGLLNSHKSKVKKRIETALENAKRKAQYSNDEQIRKKNKIEHNFTYDPVVIQPKLD